MSTKWTYLAVGLFALALLGPIQAAEDATTGTVDTRIGKIELDKGLPANAEVEQKIYDEMDFQRATQAYIWALPVVAFEEWQKANRQIFGASNTDFFLYKATRTNSASSPLTPRRPMSSAFPISPIGSFGDISGPLHRCPKGARKRTLN